MIEDFRDPASPDAFQADLCIIGAGPAGITIAAAFADSPWRVCLLESGGLHSERASQSLNAGVSIGPHALDPAACRLRTFGGATRLWGGGCIPLSTMEMARRDWIPDSGWPIDWSELAPYYARASKVCRVEPGDFEDGAFIPPEDARNRTPPSDNLEGRTCRMSPVDFGQAHLPLLSASRNLHLVLHANLIRLEAVDNASAVRSALIGGIDGRRGRVSARCFVLATGGIENARLLLLSDDVAPAGLGNDRDLVGRYFMDHPRCDLGAFRAGGMDELANRYCRPLDRTATPAHHQLSLSPHAQRKHRLPSARVWPFSVEQPVPVGIQSLRGLRAALRKRAIASNESLVVERELLDALAVDLPDHVVSPGHPERLDRLALRTALHARHIARAAGRKLAHRKTVDTDHVEMIGYFEQTPNRDSRITLAGRYDAMGLRQVQVDWRLTDIDVANIRTTAELVGGDVARHFNCDFEPAAWLRDPNAMPQVHGTAHHIGTTRMSASPAAGVVDRHCRVHGIDNLYVAGSSVFPTGGWAFPTLTIVALALRIADELRHRLGEMSMLAMV